MMIIYLSNVSRARVCVWCASNYIILLYYCVVFIADDINYFVMLYITGNGIPEPEGIFFEFPVR